MGDTIDGSSNAAQSAQESETQNKRGFWQRVISALSPSDAGETPTEPYKDVANAALDPHGMINLRRMRVEDVAVPKAEMVSVPHDIKKDDLVALFRDSGLTRIPVYKGTLDTPIGMVHLKDFALKHGFSNNGGRFSLQKMLRKVLYAPPSMPIGVLLQKMQAERIHMALVIDEYGGVDGLVTIEDLIEQVIGEIEDEHDIEEDQFWIKESDDCYLVQARAPLDEFEAEINTQLVPEDEEDEFDTMGGLVFWLAGHVPSRGEVLPHPSGIEIEVVEADPRRVKTLRLRLSGGGRG